MNLFHAQSDTFILKKGSEVKLPVVGWAHVQGNRVFPMCSVNFGGITKDHAVLHPCGRVVDPIREKIFANEEDWREFEDEPGEEPADAKPEKAVEKEPVEASGPPITYGEKTYATKSFWHVHDVNGLIQLEGGEPYPKDDRVSKVTRAEFAKLKKDGATMYVESEQSEDDDDDDDAMDLV